MKNRIIWLAVILIVGYLIAFKTYLEEKGIYDTVIVSNNLSEINNYLIKYPNGRYNREVSIRLDSLAYSSVLIDSSINSVNLYKAYCPNYQHLSDVLFIDLIKRPTLAKAKQFTSKFPKSSYEKQVNQIISDLWDKEIVLFTDNLKRENINAKKGEFFLSLLKYMKLINKNKFYVKFSHTLKLRDYEDYPEKSRKFLDELCDENSEPKISTSKIYNVENNFRIANIIDLENDITTEIQNSINNIFGSDFFELVTYHSESKELVAKDDVVFNIHYNIKNQEYARDLPELWQYSRNDMFVGWIMGIDVSFTLDLKNPQTGRSLNFDKIGNPGSEIKDFDGLTNAYGVMVSRCFRTFINETNKEIGLVL